MPLDADIPTIVPDQHVALRVNESVACKVFENIEETEDEQPSFGQIKEDAARGCSICVLLETVLPHCFEEVVNDDEVCLLGGLEDAFNIIDHAPVRDDDDSPERVTNYRPTFLSAGDLNLDNQSFCRYYGKRLRLPQKNSVSIEGTESEESLAKAVEWARVCTTFHPRCGDGCDRTLPTRVLKIDGCTVSLCISEGRTGRYAALSHCWGGSQILRLLSNTVSQFKQMIVWEELPRNFQQSIAFCRKLGIDWLWIDSLCIIQDSEADWRAEASRMALVYQNAYITIAATKAANPHAGIYTGYNSISSISTELPLKLVHQGKEHPLHALKPFNDLEDSGMKPLMTRAWAFQERLLSPRLLHFGAHELTWECREMTDCECGLSESTSPRWNTPKLIHGAISWPSDSMSSVNSDSVDVQNWQSDFRDPRIAWQRLIHTYALLRLTYAKDIFPALSGLAKEWIQHTSDEYFAGLWGSTFVEDLCWRANPASSRVMPWRAPSWSWASIERTNIEYMNPVSQHDTNLKVNVLHVECSPIGEDKTGEISAASLRLVARTIPGQLKDVNFHDMRGLVALSRDFTSHSQSLEFMPDFQFWAPGPLHVPDDWPVEVLMLLEYQIPDVDYLRIWRYFIVITQIEGDSDRWQRIGLCQLCNQEDDQKPVVFDDFDNQPEREFTIV